MTVLAREMTRRKLGFSLVEALVAASIIAVLASAAALVYFPRAREATERTEAATNLKQLALRINLYWTDHGKYPGSLKDIAGEIPLRDPRTGPLIYDLTSESTPRRNIENFEQYGFDPATDPIIYKPGINRHVGETEVKVVPDGRGGTVSYLVPILRLGQPLYVLGVRLDGSVGWFNIVGKRWVDNLPGYDDLPADQVYEAIPKHER